MSRVSDKFAKRVKGYAASGTVVRSAEGRGISRSQASLARGKELSRQNLQRINAQRSSLR